MEFSPRHDIFLRSGPPASAWDQHILSIFVASHLGGNGSLNGPNGLGELHMGECRLYPSSTARSLVNLSCEKLARSARSSLINSAEACVIEVNTYDQLQERLVSFLASNELKLLRPAVEVGSWGIGVPSAIRRALEVVDPIRHVIWVRLPYDRVDKNRSLRTVQRKLAEAVLGADVANKLMDSAEEDDDYGAVPVNDRGAVRDVSRRISEELMRTGRFLLVMQNWWEMYDRRLQDLGITLPSSWSSQNCKIILWDPYPLGTPVKEERLAPLGDPATNAWLLLKAPASMEDRLTYVYREAVDSADVLNSRSGRADLAAMITPQDVLDCLLFTWLFERAALPGGWHSYRNRSELVQYWVQNGLLMTSSAASGRHLATLEEDSIITTAEALLDEMLHRGLLLLFAFDNILEVVVMLPPLRDWAVRFTTTPAAPQAHQGFQPRKFISAVGSEAVGHLEELENVEGLYVIASDDGGSPVKNVNLPNLRTLVLVSLASFPAHDFFPWMAHLRVLIIYKAEASFLPNSLFTNLPNLRMLLLLRCENLHGLFIPGAPARSLHGLRVLSIRGSENCHSLDQAFAHMHSLRVLDISFTCLVESLSGLEAPFMKRLLLFHCFGLKTLMPHLYSHPMLEELDLGFCKSLQEEEIELKMPMLRRFRLSHSPAIRRLSFIGCSKLESVGLEELQNLESLNISRTVIKELVLHPFPSKSLVFLGAINLRAFPWKMMQHVPEVLTLDQSMVEPSNYNKDSDLSQGLSYSGRGVWMHVHDGRFFRMLCDPEKGTFSRLESSFIQDFHINISPSGKQGRKERNTSEFIQRAPHQYRGVQVHLRILPRQFPLCRHVEIQESNPSPRDIHGFLKNTLSLSVTNQHSFKSLSELMPVDSVAKQCQIEKCHGMESIFECSADSCLLQNLQSVWASELGAVVALAVEKRRSFNWSQGFKDLKHIHLEFCPRLEYIFPLGARQGLQNLEILEINLCSNLTEIFASPSQESQQPILSASSPTLPFAPRLRILHLLQLPRLVSICHEADTHWPALERFKVRGCYSLRKLPFLAYNESIAAAFSSPLPATGTVTIDGEPTWWNKVLQGGGIIANYAFHFTGIDVQLPTPKN